MPQRSARHIHPWGPQPAGAGGGASPPAAAFTLFLLQRLLQRLLVTSCRRWRCNDGRCTDACCRCCCVGFQTDDVPRVFTPVHL